MFIPWGSFNSVMVILIIGVGVSNLNQGTFAKELYLLFFVTCFECKEEGRGTIWRSGSKKFRKNGGHHQAKTNGNVGHFFLTASFYLDHGLMRLCGRYTYERSYQWSSYQWSLVVFGHPVCYPTSGTPLLLVSVFHSIHCVKVAGILQ